MKKNLSPISPHLGIYKYSWTMSLSIIHRMTGIFLSLLLVFLVFIIYLAKYDTTLLDQVLSVRGNEWYKFLLFCAIFSLFYHALNGIRHLCWDLVIGLDPKVAKLSGYFVVSISLITAIIVTFLL